MSKVYLEKYSINFSSSDRDYISDKSPLNYTVWFNDEKSKSCIYRSFKNIKKINFEHVVFPNYVQLLKQEYLSTDASYNDIVTTLQDLSATINTQIVSSENTYEICNKLIDGSTIINFTMNGIVNESFEYIDDGANITIYKYKPVSIDSPGNRIQFLSIHPCDNTQIYTTRNKNVFRYLFPKLKHGSDLYLYTRKSSITYPDNNTLQINKLVVQLLDLNGEPLIINNLDQNFDNYTESNLNETVDYNHPNHYLRHPLNPNFQLTIFMSLECFERKLSMNSVLNN